MAAVFTMMMIPHLECEFLAGLLKFIDKFIYRELYSVTGCGSRRQTTSREEEEVNVCLMFLGSTTLDAQCCFLW